MSMHTAGALLLSPLRFAGRLLLAPFRIAGRLVRSFRFWLLLTVAVIVLLVAYYAVADRQTPLTTDAYVQAYVVQVAPQVAGRVVRVYATEGDRVPRGALLFELDPRPFEHRVALLTAKLAEARQQVKQLEAALAAAKAEHRRLTAEADYARAVYEQEEVIYKKQSTTERKYLDALQKHKAAAAALERSVQNTRQAEEALAARVGDEHALVAQAQAQLAEARLDLEYTRVHAPCDGYVTDLQLREGAYVHVGQAALTCIDTSQWLVVANFREEGLEQMAVGRPALVAFQGVPGRLWPARVRNVGWGVGQGQGVPSGRLPEVRDATSWVPPSQRFQVRLTLDEPDAVPLRVGMTCSVSVYTDPHGRLNGVTEWLHRVLAWFYYL